jgi:hypothetical protein
MKTSFSNATLDYIKRVAVLQAQAMHVNPPAIPFKRDKKKKKDDDDDDEMKKMKIKLSPDEEDSEMIEVRCHLFESGEAEDWVKWRIQLDELIRDMPLTTGAKRIKVAKALLKGQAREYLLDLLLDLEMTDDADDPINDEDKFDEAIARLGARYFPTDHPYRRQRNYLRYHLFIMDMQLCDFKAELLRQNNYLRYFPVPEDRESVESLPEDELVEILDRAKRIEWQRDILTANIDPYGMTLEQYYKYLEKLEAKHGLDRALRKESESKKSKTTENDGENKTNKKRKNKNKNNNNNNKGDRKEACIHCGKFHPAKDDDCWSLAKNKDKRPKFNSSKKPRINGTENLFTALQMEAVVQALQKKDKKNQKKMEKRQVSFNVASSAASDNSNDSDSDYLDSSTVEHSFAIRIKPAGKQVNPKVRNRLTTEIIVEVVNPRGETWPLRTLIDTGTTRSVVLKDFVTLSQIVQNSRTATQWKTMAGTFTTTKVAMLNFKMPELSTSKSITWPVHVDESTSRSDTPYDLILGLDLISELKLVLDFERGRMRWGDTETEMKPRGIVTDEEALHLLYHMSQQSTVIKEAEERQAKILDADYSKVEMDEHVDSLDYLSTEERKELLATLKCFPTLFGGGLGRLKIDPIHLELKEGARPYHAKPFSIPHAYEKTTRKEIERFEQLGIWKRVDSSPWSAGTFIQPKKTGDVRVLTDFRKLNEYLVRKPHPLPKIGELLQKLEGFRWATAIDLSMGYYHIPLDEYSQGLCGTVMPWGLYQYKVLPMGISNAPDIFQSIMMRLLGDLEFVHVYMDDILITSNGTFTDHMSKLKTVLSRLQQAGFRANVRKCSFAADRVEYLGYDISRHGIHPQPKKVEAILKMQPPQTKRQLRRFLGMVNYYRDMWKRRSHILAPLTALSSKSVSWKWTKECNESFETIKRVVARETLLNFPNFEKEFHIYTDASDYQLGAVIMQDGKPLAFYSRKLNKAQRNYTTGEQELLSIVETLKEFRNILLGQKLVIHTDHLNILYSKMPSARIVRWRLMLEEYGATFVHVAGEDNVVADTMSRHPNNGEELDDEDTPVGKQLSYCMSHVPTSEDDDYEYSYADLITVEDIEDETFPLSPKVIDRYQRKDKELLRKARRDSSAYSTIELEGVTLIAKHGKVIVPEALQDRLVESYHELLQHPGMNRMEATIRHVFDWRGLREKVEEHCRTCDLCQLTKKQKKKYGKLPVKEAEVTPWKRVNVDVIGPYTVRTPSGTHILQAMTMIDPVTGWFEVAPLPPDEVSSYECQKAFDAYWLARYPRPQQVGVDNGSTFKRHFKQLCKNYGLERKPSTEYNPQSNGIIERVHQVLANALRSFELEERELDSTNPWDEFLTAAAFAIRSTHHTTLGASPAQLVYGRDMFLPVNYVADWARIRMQKQKLINKSNERENKSRIPHEYQVNDRVLLTTPGKLPKMRAPRTGPYRVVHVHNNGTVTIQNGPVQQRVNIRRIMPYWQRR